MIHLSDLLQFLMAWWALVFFVLIFILLVEQITKKRDKKIREMEEKLRRMETIEEKLEAYERVWTSC